MNGDVSSSTSTSTWVLQCGHALLLLIPGLLLPIVIDIAFVIGFVAMMLLSIGEGLLHRTEARVPLIDRLLGSISGVSLLLIVWSVLFNHERPASLTSMPLLVIGISLRLVAMRKLGKGFRTDARPASAIRRDGVFRLRHPSEIGLLLLGLGLLTLRGHAGILVFFVGLLPASIVRIVREETSIYDVRTNPELLKQPLDT